VVPSSTLSSRDDEVQDECTARIDPEAIRRKYKKPAGFGTRLQTTWQSMNHTKRSVLIGVVAFVLTLVIAFTVMWILSAPDDVPAGPTVVETTIAAPAEKPVPEVEARPVSPIGDPGRSCTPLGRYDRTFPFREVLVRTGAALSVNNVCGFFGTSPAAIAKVFRSDQVVGPTGDDWVAEGGQLEIYPSGTVGEKEPSIQFLFVKDHLVRVRLRLRDAKAGNRLTVARLQKFFRMLDSRTDHLGRRITTLRDQDLNVLYAEEDWYGQVLKTLEFSSVQVDETLADVFASARELETAWKAAETAYFAWKFDEAMAGYDKVLSLSEGVGMAHVKRGLIALRDDDFGKTAELAARALEVTRDNGVKAEAYGLQAVIALRNDARGEALELLKKAAALAPAAERFRTGVAQLETGEYAEAHVAQTAARLACIKQGKSRASELGVLARGLFPDMKTYNRALAAVSRSRQFRSTRDNYMQWECR